MELVNVMCFIISGISVSTELSDMSGCLIAGKVSKADPSLTTPEPTPEG
jgi:hypothetical protein